MSQEAAQQTYDNNSAIRTAVNKLTELLEWLYPEPSPDIFTVRDYRNRYPFTRLGRLATADIDRYQRINRAVGSHVQIGLCEYHIGLIYLHEGAFRGAVQAFDLARQQWSFVNEPVAVSLTYLGRAVAQQLADHYELAFVSVGKVTGWLDRARFAEPFPGWNDFHEQVLAYVAGLQASLRKQLDSFPQTPDPAPYDTYNEPFMPDSNEFRNCKLYQVTSNEDQFIPEIEPGTWLIVNNATNIDAIEKDELVVIAKEESVRGAITLRPPTPDTRFPRIYLATVQLEGTFTRDQYTGRVAFSPRLQQLSFNYDEFLGIVVGFIISEA